MVFGCLFSVRTGVSADNAGLCVNRTERTNEAQSTRHRLFSVVNEGEAGSLVIPHWSYSDPMLVL